MPSKIRAAFDQIKTARRRIKPATEGAPPPCTHAENQYASSHRVLSKTRKTTPGRGRKQQERKNEVLQLVPGEQAQQPEIIAPRGERMRARTHTDGGVEIPGVDISVVRMHMCPHCGERYAKFSDHASGCTGLDQHGRHIPLVMRCRNVHCQQHEQLVPVMEHRCTRYPPRNVEREAAAARMARATNAGVYDLWFGNSRAGQINPRPHLWRQRNVTDKRRRLEIIGKEEAIDSLFESGDLDFTNTRGAYKINQSISWVPRNGDETEQERSE